MPNRSLTASKRIPDEAVERALQDWDRDYYRTPRLLTKDRMRSAIEASGAVFLTDEERRDVLEAIGNPSDAPIDDAIRSAKEKLGRTFSRPSG